MAGILSLVGPVFRIEDDAAIGILHSKNGILHSKIAEFRRIEARKMGFYIVKRRTYTHVTGYRESNARE